MFNDRLSSEAANERIQERMRETEMYRLQKQLGIGEYGTAKWVLALIVLIVAVVFLVW